MACGFETLVQRIILWNRIVLCWEMIFTLSLLHYNWNLSYLFQPDVFHITPTQKGFGSIIKKAVWMPVFQDILRTILNSLWGSFWSRSSLWKLDFAMCPWLHCEFLLYPLPTLGLRLPKEQQWLLSGKNFVVLGSIPLSAVCAVYQYVSVSLTCNYTVRPMLQLRTSSKLLACQISSKKKTI